MSSMVELDLLEYGGIDESDVSDIYNHPFKTQSKIYADHVYECRWRNINCVIVARNIDEAKKIAKKYFRAKFVSKIFVKFAGRIGKEWQLPKRVGIY